MTISLSSVIYPPQCLGATITAFADFCSVRIVREQHQSYSIEISPVSPVSNDELLTHEFLNYLLALSIENHLINGLN